MHVNLHFYQILYGRILQKQSHFKQISALCALCCRCAGLNRAGKLLWLLAFSLLGANNDMSRDEWIS